MVGLALAAAVISVSFDAPVVEGTNAEIKGFNMVGNRASMDMDLTVHLVNNNRWPIEGTLKDFDVDMYAVDKEASDEVGDMNTMGVATLPQPVKVPAQFRITLVLTAAPIVEASGTSAQLFLLLARDCGSVFDVWNFASRKTKIRVAFTRAVPVVADT